MPRYIVCWQNCKTHNAACNYNRKLTKHAAEIAAAKANLNFPEACHWAEEAEED